MPWSEAQLEEAAEFYSEINDIYTRHSIQLRGRRTELMMTAPPAMNNAGASTWPHPITSSGQIIQIQLAEPPKVPKFSGLEIDWANFRAQFEAEVYNNSQLSNAQKLRKLLGALEGRAKQAIGDWPTTDDASYELAWQALCRQYGNDYNTIRAHMAKLFALRIVRQPTAEALREILDTTRVTHRQLSLMLTADKVAEYFLLHRLERLMDTESQSQWATRRTTNALPTLDELYEFLEIRASLLAAAPAAKSREEPRATAPQKGANAAPAQNFEFEPRPGCELCPGERHFPYQCKKFRSMKLVDRRAHVAKLRMCANCFGRHATATCGKPKCPRCREGHNSTLCPRNSKIEGAGETQRQTAARTDMEGDAAASTSRQ